MDFTNWDDLPLILRPKHLIGMGMKKDKAYEMFNSRSFPLIKQGRQMYVEKTALKNWLERKGKDEIKR